MVDLPVKEPVMPKGDHRGCERVLCVDDEPKILAVYQRMLQGQFDIEIADGPEKGLEAVTDRGPFAVVVSDMRMPKMSGAEFLGRVRKLSPASVRMLLTGYSDQASAVAAINEGNVFRFLSKPCSKDALQAALSAGIEQYRLIVSEKELLEGTLRGSIRVLTELLGIVNPMAFGRTERVKRTMQKLAELLNIEKGWQFEVAALLSQVGCITLSESVLTKIAQRDGLTAREQSQIDAHPGLAANLIRNIPRLSEVAEIIACQNKQFDGKGGPDDGRHGQEIPIGARALKAALDFDSLRAGGETPSAAIATMRARTGWYDPTILSALDCLPQEWAGYSQESRFVYQMRAGMILDEDVRLPNGFVVARKGFELTEIALARLMDYCNEGLIKGAIQLLVPPAG